MDIDVMRVWELAVLDSKDKQKVEGCCFLYNCQGHIKWNCPTNEKWKDSPRSLPHVVQVAQVNSQSEEKGEEGVPITTLQGVEDLMTKLRGMSIADQDEVIDALISQEGF